MKIHGLQKMTLLDFPGHVACTVFLGGCDFRCPFCHNSDLLDLSTAPVYMEEDELLAFLKSRRGLLEGVAITGGEPTLRADLIPALEKIRELGYPVKLDSNGNRPEVLRALVEKELVSYIAMDIKNSPERYAETVGRSELDLGPIRESLAFLRSGVVDYELRTTVVKEFHDDASFHGIAELIEGAGRYYLQCFTDRDTVLYGGLHAPTREELLRYAGIVRPRVSLVELRGV